MLIEIKRINNYSLNLFIMKRIALFCGSLLIAATMLFVACGKDKEPTINKFFTIDNATLIAENMPGATCDRTIDVLLNGRVIPGGSSYVTVTSENVAKKILIGLKDQVGYWEYTIPQSNDRDYSYSFVLLVDQNIALPDGQDALEILVAVVDESGDISQIWQTPVQIIEVGTGGLQVSLSFDNAKDVDLHLIEPEYTNEWGDPAYFYERHIYYSNRMSSAGGELDLDSNPGCSLDYVNNENITYNDSTAFIPAGTYKVYVDMYSNCDASIATNYVVTVFYGGNLIATKAGVFEVGAESTYNPISEEYVEANEPFLSFTIADHGQKCMKSFAPAPMTESAIEKEANAAHK